MCAERANSPSFSPDRPVAVVDDDPAVRRAITQILRTAGWQVASFSSAEELLPELAELRPGCLVLDVVLPGMSGPDLLDRMKETAVSPPTVLVTGRIDVLPSLRRRGLGAVPLLQKPFEPDLLVDAVSRALASGEA